MYGHGFGFMGIFGTIIWILIIILVIAGISITVKLFNKPDKKSSISNALIILKERYAKGEITKEEFEKIKNEILK